MNLRLTLLVSLLLAGFAHAATAARSPNAASTAKPNIVVILSDDYGWGSLGCYGAPAGVKTPHLDRLAREGRRFTQAYAPGSVCSPTRYGLMTGRYYWRTSVKDGEVLPGNAPLHIETNRVTLASLCKAQGYRTGGFGKWHLGMGTQMHPDWSGELKPGPLDIGFDYFFGLGSNPWSGPHSFIENRTVIGALPGQPVIVQAGGRENNKTTGIEKPWVEENIMQTLTQKVVGWLEQQSAAAPFFLYYAPNAVHEPVAPNPKFSGSPYGKYGDFIHELDWSVGEVLATLDRLKLAENTLVIFTSDNGGVVNPGNPNAAKAMSAGLPINGPLRGGKHSEWEGGFREPFIVRWPGKVPAATVSDQVIGLTDVLATLAGMFHTSLPKGNAEDSFDVMRAFTEAKAGAPVREHMILQAASSVYAIRMGDWKLVERVDAPKFEHRNAKKAKQAANKVKAGPGHDELYNLKDDPAETKDVAIENSALVTKMKTMLVEARSRGSTRSGAN
jgi:arylsulfatase A-like enzyme